MKFDIKHAEEAPENVTKFYLVKHTDEVIQLRATNSAVQGGREWYLLDFSSNGVIRARNGLPNSLGLNLTPEGRLQIGEF